VHAALLRECREELGSRVHIQYLSGVYYHAEFNAHALIFRASLPPAAPIQLSAEHAAWRYAALDELSAVQRHRVAACLAFAGVVDSACF
jgi:8-oxo-dGTP pyrophosphatase MutT (NUDIX family)